MVKHHAMEYRGTSRNRLKGTFTGRFAIGLLVSLSLVLVAFEWRSEARSLPPLIIELPPEPPWESVPVIIVEKEARSDKASVTRKPRERISVIPAPDPPVDEGTGSEAMDPPVGPTDPPVTGSIPNGDTTTPRIDPPPWGGKEVRPYFLDCLKRSPKALDECTEYRIHQHMLRYFRMPRSIRGEVRTTVTFQIDDTGRIGRIAYTPRVSEEVEREIERVLRELPGFVPGTQNGIPVPVIHRMPVVLRSR